MRCLHLAIALTALTACAEGVVSKQSDPAQESPKPAPSPLVFIIGAPFGEGGQTTLTLSDSGAVQVKNLSGETERSFTGDIGAERARALLADLDPTDWPACASTGPVVPGSVRVELRVGTPPGAREVSCWERELRERPEQAQRLDQLLALVREVSGGAVF